MNEITYKAYWDEVRSCAEAVKDETSPADLDELVDTHEWIIYTYANLQVLVHSKNSNAYFEETGEKLNTEDFSSTVQRLAYWAFRADIQEAM